jgi:hypothetical protein
MAKLSTYPVATTVGNADNAFGLQGGADVQMPRALLLTAVAGQPIALVGNGASATLDGVGNLTVDVPAGKALNLSVNGVSLVLLSGAGGVQIQPVAGQGLVLNCNGAVAQIDAAGNIGLAPAGGSTLFAGYTPQSAGDWVVAPTDLLVAVDRIARVVSAFGVTPIP